MFREVLKIETKAGCVDITETIMDVIKKCGIKDGLCHIFLPGTTAGFVMNENDRMLIEDFNRFFNNLAPENRLYNHPSNAFSHIKASLTSTEKTIPIADSELVLGTWQSIFLWEFDIRPRKRELIITITGEFKT